MANHSSVLAWRIPGMVEPDGLLSVGSHRVGHEWLYPQQHTEEPGRPGRLQFMGLQGVGHEWLTLALFHFHTPE